MTPQPDDLVRVRLVHVPVPVQVAASAHMAALQREFDVLSAAADRTSVPGRLVALIAELEERYGGVGEQPGAELEAAIERGDDVIDLEYVVPRHTAEACVRLGDLLDEVDDYCRQGDLLTLATPPESLAYRRWFLGEFVAQISGASPTPWEDVRDDVGSAVEDGTGAGAGSAAEDGAEVSAEDRPALDGGANGRAPVPEGGAPAGWQVEERHHEVTVRPTGELDLQTAPQLRDVVQHVRREHTARVVLDLSSVSFVDSVGLSVIVSAHQRLVDDGVDFHVVISDQLERLFHISGLDDVLHLRTAGG